MAVFWFVCQFLMSFLSSTFTLAITLEVILNAISEGFPSIGRFREAYPRNLILMAIWGYISFAASLITLQMEYGKWFLNAA